MLLTVHCGSISVFVVRTGFFFIFQCLQPNPTFLERTNLPFKLTWGWALRGVGSGREEFNCKAKHEHHLVSVLSCSFFSPCFTQDGTFLIFGLVPDLCKRCDCLCKIANSPAALIMAYPFLHALHMLIRKFSSWRYFSIGFAVPEPCGAP